MKGLGDLMKQAQRMKAEMDRIQAEVAAKSVEGSAGGGMVTVVANGKCEILSVRIDPEVARGEDLEMLQDLVMAASNEATKKVDQETQSKMSGMLGGMGLPPGLV